VILPVGTGLSGPSLPEPQYPRGQNIGLTGLRLTALLAKGTG
jgi:hypothetical protein